MWEMNLSPPRLKFDMQPPQPLTATSSLTLQAGVETNSVFSKDGHFILSKFGVNLWKNDRAMCVQKSADRQKNRQTDRQMAFSALYGTLIASGAYTYTHSHTDICMKVISIKPGAHCG